MLAVGTGGEAVRLFDAATGKVRWKLQVKQGDIVHMVRVSMSPDGRFVAAVSDHGETWKLWDAASGAERLTGARHDGSGACICKVNAKGRRTSLEEGCPVRTHTAGLRALAFSPSNKTLATGGEDRTVILWDVQTGEAGHRLQGDGGAVYALSFSGSGEKLASGNFGGGVSVWDTTTGTLLLTIPHAHNRYVWSVQWSPIDPARLATTGRDNFVKQWDVDSGEMLKSFEGRCCAVFSPDGRKIAAANPNGERDVHLIDVETGALRLVMAGHAETLTTATFSADGSVLATGSYDGTCKVWDLSGGALLRTIELGKGPVCLVVWGRDWVRDTQRGAAFAMGNHPRLGAKSHVLALEPEVVRMILDRVS